MNICLLSGRVTKNATVRGTDPKTVVFTLETRNGPADGDKPARVACVPCVLFNPPPEVEAVLTTRGEGLPVELEGRLSAPPPDANGGRRFNTEVIVRNRTFVVLTAVPQEA